MAPLLQTTHHQVPPTHARNVVLCRRCASVTPQIHFKGASMGSHPCLVLSARRAGRLDILGHTGHRGHGFRHAFGGYVDACRFLLSRRPSSPTRNIERTDIHVAKLLTNSGKVHAHLALRFSETSLDDRSSWQARGAVLHYSSDHQNIRQSKGGLSRHHMPGTRFSLNSSVSWWPLCALFRLAMCSLSLHRARPRICTACAHWRRS